MTFSFTAFSRSQICDVITSSVKVEQVSALELQLTQEEAYWIIKGHIGIENSDELLIGAHVLVKETNFGAVSDYDGSYELKIPRSKVKETIELEVSYVGLTTETRILKLDNNDTMVLDIELKENNSLYYSIDVVVSASRATVYGVMTTGVVVLHETNKETTLYQWVKNRLKYPEYYTRIRQQKKEDRQAKRLAKKTQKENRPIEMRTEKTPSIDVNTTLATIAPNPTSDIITITTYFEENKKLEIGIFTLNGKLVYQREQQVIEGKQTFSIDLDQNLPSATYVLRMNDGKEFLFTEQVVLIKTQ